MSDKEQALKHFLEDTANHQLTIIRDDGLHRHIELRRPGSSCYYFGLINWPGHLTIYGDMGTVTFQRIYDMFDFFRENRDDGKLHINPSYWAEKVQGLRHDGRRACQEFDTEGFCQTLTKLVDKYAAKVKSGEIAVADEFVIPNARRVIDEITEYNADQNTAMVLIRNFYEADEVFGEWWELGDHRYTSQFLWLCYAIQWGIQKYDLKKMAVAAVTKSINMRGLVA